jgi:hypothetical protein
MATLDIVKNAAEDPSLPSTVPSELGNELVAMSNGFTDALVKMYPDASAQGGEGGAAPVASAAPTADEKLASLIEFVETLKSDLTAKGFAPSGGVASVAKAIGIKKNVMASMKVYNDGFSKFIALLLELLPLVTAMQEAEMAPVDPTAAPAGATPTATAPETVSEEANNKAIAKGVETALKALGIDKLPQQLKGIEERVEVVAKARPGSAGLNDDNILTAKKATGYIDDVSDKLRREGRI